MVKKLAIIREIFKGDHNAAAARKLTRNQISALSGTLNYFKNSLKKIKTCSTERRCKSKADSVEVYALT